jgi:hypothetical protein
MVIPTSRTNSTTRVESSRVFRISKTTPCMADGELRCGPRKSRSRWPNRWFEEQSATMVKTDRHQSSSLQTMTNFCSRYLPVAELRPIKYSVDSHVARPWRLRVSSSVAFRRSLFLAFAEYTICPPVLLTRGAGLGSQGFITFVRSVA